MERQICTHVSAEGQGFQPWSTVSPGYRQGARSEVDQLGHESMLIQNASTAEERLLCCPNNGHIIFLIEIIKLGYKNHVIKKKEMETEKKKEIKTIDKILKPKKKMNISNIFIL